MRNPEDVDHGEQRFHHHLEHHGDGEQGDRARDGPLSEVAMRVAENGVLDRGPEAGVAMRRVVMNRSGHDSYRLSRFWRAFSEAEPTLTVPTCRRQPARRDR